MTMRVPITIVVPVGPKQHHRQHLDEMLGSLYYQTLQPDEVLLINDGGSNITAHHQLGRFGPGPWIKEWGFPCNCGMVAAWNCGVALAKNDLCVLMGADDKLMETCCEQLWYAWGYHRDPYGYYYLGVRYSEREPDQNTPCNAAMVHKTLWKHTGGFPPQAAVGAPDHIFLNMMLVAMNERRTPMQLIRVSDEVLYWYRVGDATETTNNIWPAIEAVKEWTAAKWTPRDSYIPEPA